MRRCLSVRPSSAREQEVEEVLGRAAAATGHAADAADAADATAGIAAALMAAVALVEHAAELVLELGRELVERVGRQVQDLVEDVVGHRAAGGLGRRSTAAAVSPVAALTVAALVGAAGAAPLAGGA